ncbi:tRNA-specific 2-thiouridylase [Microbacterium halimionae]|uniref:tRNA-specific 2-thiouridylase MnmA n=1 Tax=Microbacterium halimionae TaxID=1526413 RepID=A0A7W3PLG1_9MICO|nr:tRNA 2-thiouridine(34) synthase MnmA [Microbacterium halimionae]MBA8815922.1 tRNA-specific 2-thiouridylase [Microbacterium halimionae]NII96125.1 tRNA-specific 2-thiouridylase [Microbacterium halimionae]
MRVLAAMSGGVDSAVAAARAVDEGHDVVGVHLALSRAGGTLRAGSRGCCTIEDAMDARRASDLLGIPFYVWDFSERFRDDVIEDFISEYQAGRTPNPCMRCNEKIKFAALLERAIELGFDAVCTGHYATLVDEGNGLELHRASDAAKDQSYVLGVLTEEQLRYTYFPLGSTPSKAIVRAEAQARGLTVANKPDSHDICFIPDGDTRGWLGERVGAETGEVLDRNGDVVGSHEGAHAFTVGQRRGLKLGVPASDGKPRFVLEVRPVSNTVVVGPKEALATAEISGVRFSWAGRAPLETEFRCHVQIRAHSEPVPALATWQNGTVTATPDVPFDGVAPGQTAVLYDGTRVVGQFTVDKTVSAVPVNA